jgi:hypothetical protein
MSERIKMNKTILTICGLLLICGTAFGQPYKRIQYYVPQPGASDTALIYNGNNTTQPDSVWSVLTTVGPYWGKIGGLPVSHASEQEASTIAGFSTGSLAIGNYKQVGHTPLMTLLPNQAVGDSNVHALVSQGSSTAPIWGTIPTTGAGITDTVPIAHGGTGMHSSGVTIGADTATTGQALIGSQLQLTTLANQRYYVEGNIIATSSSAAGIQLGVRIPTGDTGYFVFDGTDTTTLQSNKSAVTADSGLTAAYGQLNGTCYVTVRGTVSGPTAGPVILGFLKVTSGTATLKKWSTLIWKRLY